MHTGQTLNTQSTLDRLDRYPTLPEKLLLSNPVQMNKLI